MSFARIKDTWNKRWVIIASWVVLSMNTRQELVIFFSLASNGLLKAIQHYIEVRICFTHEFILFIYFFHVKLNRIIVTWWWYLGKRLSELSDYKGVPQSWTLHGGKFWKTQALISPITIFSQDGIQRLPPWVLVHWTKKDSMKNCLVWVDTRRVATRPQLFKRWMAVSTR